MNQAKVSTVAPGNECPLRFTDDPNRSQRRNIRPKPQRHMRGQRSAEVLA